MPSLLKSKKSQFFILSTVSIIFALTAYMKIFSPINIVYTSEVVMRNEPFVFNNIVEKSMKVVDVSKDCEDLRFNLEEYSKLLNETFSFYRISFNYTITCNPTSAIVDFQIALFSPNFMTNTSFRKTKTW